MADRTDDNAAEGEPALDQFPTALRAYRKARGYTLARLAAALGERGVTVSGANIGAWERGQYGPGNRDTVLALEEILDTGGRLAALLGYATERNPDDDAIWAALKEVTSRLQRLEDAVRAQLADRVRREL